MTKLALVAADTAAPAPSTARLALSDHLARMAAARLRYDALRQTWDAMQQAKHYEASCRSVLQTQVACEEAAMRAWAANPKGPMPKADVVARECNEGALASAKREADTIRSAEPEQSARMAAVTRELTAMQERLPEYVNAILLEDAPNIRTELAATVAKANSLSAQLFGLRNFLHDTGAHNTGNEVPVSFEMWPEQRAIMAAQREWQAHAARLAADPTATLQTEN